MSDFKVEHRAFWVHVCQLAREAGVPTVVFTKMQACVEALSPHVTRMVISRDNSARWDFGSPAWVADDAVIAEYKAQFDNVVTSAMVVDERDIYEVPADFYIAHHGKYSHLNFDKRITQERVIEIVGKKRGCTPAHRCVGCPTACMVRQKHAVDISSGPRQLGRLGDLERFEQTCNQVLASGKQCIRPPRMNVAEGRLIQSRSFYHAA